MEYTNAISQCLKAKSLYDEVKGANDRETIENIKRRKAKFTPVALYITCTVIAMIIAYNYFYNIENPWLHFGAVALAGIFNIPFLAYYAVWHVALKHPEPSYTKAQWETNKQGWKSRFPKSNNDVTSLTLSP